MAVALATHQGVCRRRAKVRAATPFADDMALALADLVAPVPPTSQALEHFVAPYRPTDRPTDQEQSY